LFRQVSVRQSPRLGWPEREETTATTAEGGGDLEKHCGRTLFSILSILSILSMDRLILRLILNVDERLCRAKGRGTWAESARATSRSFATLIFFFFSIFVFSSLSLSLKVYMCICLRARAKSAKSEKQKAQKADQGFFGALRKGFKSVAKRFRLAMQTVRAH
jgi:hypothetical protein